MNRTELKEELNMCINLSYEEPELAHRMADEALLKYIEHPEVTRLFDEIVKDY